MRKKKVDVLRPNNIWDSDVIKISKDYDDYYFEIGKEVTNDIAEAVSIMMRNYRQNDAIWDLSISDIDYYNIKPSKCLYWLSGGDNEWIKNRINYKKNWFECELEFQEEFGIIVISILKKSKTLSDIRVGFIKYLNLPTLYNFAIEKNIV